MTLYLKTHPKTQLIDNCYMSDQIVGYRTFIQCTAFVQLII